ncbi:MAG: hypothetical protein VB038_04805 [Methanobrevibacter sp.]|uniref:hypothetical protein n=1 Tax=Methanobrevibacter sp. TaxID=66852 RepID=UPI002624BB39|nr:hypothetical protein [Methanobrevibacter sp.]MEA4957027.1 hypothetical protein [Methanobrevibacter sp.]
MSKNTNQYLRNDLRKKTNISDFLFFKNISFQSCMVILFVFVVLLFSILSIATTPNPSVIFGI